jgi:hypothetical protein
MQGDERQQKKGQALRYEVAEELGLSEKIRQGGWEALSDAEFGRIGEIIHRRKKPCLTPQPGVRPPAKTARSLAEDGIDISSRQNR